MATDNSSTNSSNLQPNSFCSLLQIKVVVTALALFYVLLCPIFLLILHIGYKKWQRNGNFSHFDVFTFNIVGIEICAAVGAGLALYGVYYDIHNAAIEAGIYMTTINSIGQMCFQSLTCVDQYLAVVHPVTYLSLKKGTGVTIRNTIIGLIWLFSIGYSLLTSYTSLYMEIAGLLFLFLSIALIVFCTISVLCTLICPTPGELNVTRRRTDRSKRRAFYIIVLILTAFLMRLISDVFFFLIVLVQMEHKYCFSDASTLLFYLPSSLLLPVLFLHRARNAKDCVKLCQI